jgi:hypothetical protein
VQKSIQKEQIDEMIKLMEKLKQDTDQNYNLDGFTSDSSMKKSETLQNDII